MSQLIIADLNFCESEFPSKSEVKGGRRRSRNGRISTDLDTGLDTDLDTCLNIKNGTVEYGVSDAVSTGVATALSLDGSPTEANVDVNARARCSF